MQSTSNLGPSEENIRFRAYLLWEADGRQDGRDDHYWSEAVAQLHGEGSAPLEQAPATVSKAARAKKVPYEDVGVLAAKPKKAKATSAGKTGAAEAGNAVKAKGGKKASTKAGGNAAEKSEVVAKPKSAKKTKTVDVAASAPESAPEKTPKSAPKSTPVTAPTRAKKPRKAVADDSQSPSP